jgi:hypothetical protein
VQARHSLTVGREESWRSEATYLLERFDAGSQAIDELLEQLDSSRRVPKYGALHQDAAATIRQLCSLCDVLRYELRRSDGGRRDKAGWITKLIAGGAMAVVSTLTVAGVTTNVPFFQGVAAGAEKLAYVCRHAKTTVDGLEYEIDYVTGVVRVASNSRRTTTVVRFTADDGQERIISIGELSTGTFEDMSAR